VDKGQLLYTVDTELVMKEVRPALINYIKSKKTLVDANQKQEDAIFLYKNDIISRMEYHQALEAYDTAQFSVIEARQKLKQIVNLLQFKQRRIDLFNRMTQLDISHPDKILKLLEEIEESNHFLIHAPISGILLMDNRSSYGQFSSNRQKSIGKSIKQGDLLANIGTRAGIRIAISINMTDIHKVRVGQKAIVTMPTLPGEQLIGHVSSIGLQAVNDRGVAKVQATVIANHLSDTIQHNLYLGVNAKVAIMTKTKPAVIIPINAINFAQNNQTSVEVIGKDGTIQKVPVTIGISLEKSIMITSGLHKGDKILVPNH